MSRTPEQRADNGPCGRLDQDAGGGFPDIHRSRRGLDTASRRPSARCRHRRSDQTMARSPQAQSGFLWCRCSTSRFSACASARRHVRSRREPHDPSIQDGGNNPSQLLGVSSDANVAVPRYRSPYLKLRNKKREEQWTLPHVVPSLVLRRAPSPQQLSAQSAFVSLRQRRLCRSPQIRDGPR